MFTPLFVLPFTTCHSELLSRIGVTFVGSILLHQRTMKYVNYACKSIQCIQESHSDDCPSTKTVQVVIPAASRIIRRGFAAPGPGAYGVIWSQGSSHKTLNFLRRKSGSAGSHGTLSPAVTVLGTVDNCRPKRLAFSIGAAFRTAAPRCQWGVRAHGKVSATPRGQIKSDATASALFSTKE